MAPVDVLLVDDREDDRALIADWLEGQGVRIVEAPSGEDALAILADLDPALVILDVTLGKGIEGFEVARRIRESERTRHTPIVFMSAFRLDELSFEEGYGSGAVDYLSKPVNPLLLKSKVAVFADLHRLRRRAESQAAEIMQLQTERIRSLEDADKVKDEFLSVVSHELRTPLNAIVASASMLTDGMAGPLSDAQLDFVGKITAGSDLLLQQVNNLLDLSRIQAGKFRVEPRLCNFTQVATDVLAILTPLAEQRKHVLVVDIGPDLPEVFVDEDRLGQVLLNLVGNAMKFTPPGSRITVGAWLAADRFHCEVRDNGQGIAPENLDRIFERFTQVDMSSTRSKGGSGLGLSICKALIEAHGGTMGVDSRVGAGCRFWFAIPQGSVSRSAGPR